MGGNFFPGRPLSSRWKKNAGSPGFEGSQPVVVPVEARFSLSQITTYHSSLTEEIPAVAEAGFDGIGLWRTKLLDQNDEAVAARLREFGLKGTSLSFAGGFTGSLGFSYEEALEDAREAVRQTARLGVETLILVTGGRNGHTMRHCRRTVKEALWLLADEAGDCGVRVALLPMHARFQAESTFLHGLDDTLGLLDELSHPHTGLVFDSAQLWDTPELLSRIPQIAPRTFVVQLTDSPVDPRANLDRCLPGRGTLPLTEIVQQFLSHGYQGLFDIQVWSEAVWRMSQTEVISACNVFQQSIPTTVVRYA
ncbi:MAG: sugar phosphate isomerase/epimerase [Planctomycetaceae bacterium]